MKFRLTSCQVMSGVILLFAIFYIVSEYRRIETFWTSPGTLVQLETSHVPTLEDLQEYQRERKRIHRDLISLTGSA